VSDTDSDDMGLPSHLSPPLAAYDDGRSDTPPDPFGAAGPAGAAPTDPLARSGLPRNDLGNAKRLMMIHGADMLYEQGLGWGVWDGRRYDFGAGGLHAQAKASDLYDLLQEEAAAAAKGSVSDDEATAMMVEKQIGKDEAIKRIPASHWVAAAKFAVTCGNAGRVAAALTMLKPMRIVKVEDLDAVAHKVTSTNGAIDLRKVGKVADIEAEEPEERLA
jgi:hypothetical protein